MYRDNSHLRNNWNLVIKNRPMAVKLRLFCWDATLHYELFNPMKVCSAHVLATNYFFYFICHIDVVYVNLLLIESARCGVSQFTRRTSEKIQDSTHPPETCVVGYCHLALTSRHGLQLQWWHFTTVITKLHLCALWVIVWLQPIHYSYIERIRTSLYVTVTRQNISQRKPITHRPDGKSLIFDLHSNNTKLNAVNVQYCRFKPEYVQFRTYIGSKWPGCQLAFFSTPTLPKKTA